MVISKTVSKIVFVGIGELLIIISAFFVYESYTNSNGSFFVYSIIVVLLFAGSGLRIYAEEIIDFILKKQWKRFLPHK